MKFISALITLLTITLLSHNLYSQASNLPVTINPAAPVINKCNPVPVQLVASYALPSSKYSWSWAPSVGLSATNISNPVATPSVTTTYTVTATDSASNVSIGTVVVTVGPFISVVNGSVCAGSTTAQLPYDGTGGNPNQYSITWNGAALSAGLANVTSDTLNPNLFSSGLGAPVIEFPVPGNLTKGSSYNGTLYAEDSTGCVSAGYAFTLMVDSGPPPNVAFANSQLPDPAHQGDNVTLTSVINPSSPAATDWSWSPVDILGFSGYITVTNSLNNISLLNDVQYDGASIRGPGSTWWIIFAENACGLVDDQGPLYFSQVVPLTIHSNPTACGDSDGTIGFPGLIPSTTYNITYFFNAIMQAPIIGLETDTTGLLLMTNLKAGSYSQMMLAADGWTPGGDCPYSEPADSIILVGTGSSLPTIKGNVSACAGSAGNVYRTQAGSTNYSWNISAGGTITSGGGATDSTATVTWNAAGAQTLSVNYNSVCPSFSPGTINVVVNNAVTPSISISTPHDTICEGTTALFSASGMNGGTTPKFQWQVNGTDVGTDSTGYFTNTLVNSDIINCIITSNAACATDSTTLSNGIVIQVNAPAVAGTLSTSKDTICVATATEISVSGSSGAIHWQSSSTSGNFTTISGATKNSYTAVFSHTTYLRVYTTSGVCSDTSDIIRLTTVPAPVAVFTDTVSGMKVTFNSSGSIGATSYYWDFGDNTTSTDADPVHTYDSVKTYDVCLTVKNFSNCNYTDCLNVLTFPTGINNVNIGSIKIYPNPFTNTIIIEQPQTGNSNETVEIYNLLGEIVYSRIFGTPDKTMQIDVSDLPKSMYLVKVRTNSGDYLQPLIKQ